MLNFSDALLLIIPIYILLLIWGIIKKYSISKHILLFGMGVHYSCYCNNIISSTNINRIHTINEIG